ncbi:MAG TPA: c-type cytochrome [Saprospiraceae bacterium]|nr:c-type cytochrome [Saprospiraceae bacterium]
MSNGFYYPAMWLVIGGLALGLVLLNSSLAFYRKQVSHDPVLRGEYNRTLRVLMAGHRILWVFVLALVSLGFLAMYQDYSATQKTIAAARKQHWPVYDKQKMWETPDPYLAETDADAKLVAYGRDLIAHTQDYFGKDGFLRPASINGLNCQNCHLDAGSKPFGNNYFAVESTYPQMRARSGMLETVRKRVNDCFVRSLNGQALDTTGREMNAIVAYLRWLGTGVPKGEKPKGSGLVEVPFLDRAADPAHGKQIYAEKCASCHGPSGQGQPMPGNPRDYPPLWGPESYNEGAGLFRMSRFAGYVKANMPFGANYSNPQLTDEEAWDVAAFVNSQPRPKHPFLDTDWPKIEKKPYDHPFGPYADTFPQEQHKYGPFGPILAFYKSQPKKN